MLAKYSALILDVPPPLDVGLDLIDGNKSWGTAIIQACFTT
jgi:hypothetical protein